MSAKAIISLSYAAMSGILTRQGADWSRLAELWPGLGLGPCELQVAQDPHDDHTAPTRKHPWKLPEDRHMTLPLLSEAVKLQVHGSRFGPLSSLQTDLHVTYTQTYLCLIPHALLRRSLTHASTWPRYR